MENLPETRAVKRGILGLTLAPIVVVILGCFLYLERLQRLALEDASNELQAISNLKISQIESWLQERRSGAGVIFASSLIQDGLQAILDGAANTPNTDRIQDWMAQFRANHLLDAVLLYDREGVTRASVPSAPGNPFTRDVAAFQEALKGKAVAMQDLHLDPTPSSLHLEFFIPVGSGRATGHPSGVLGLRVNPRQTLFPLVQQGSVPHKTADTLLVRLEGDQVVYLNEPRHRTGAPAQTHLPLTETNLPAVQAALGRQGFFAGLDDRGVKVAAWIQSVPSTPWKMVAKVDLDEIYQLYRQDILAMIAVATSLMAATILGGRAIYRKRELDLMARQLKITGERLESEARYHEIFENSPIGIWEEDFSKVKERFDSLRASGVENLRIHLDANPGEVSRLASLVRVVRVNAAGWRSLGLGCEAELFEHLTRVFSEESLGVFKEELIELEAGRLRFRCEAPMRNLAGETRWFELFLAVPEGFEASLARVLVSTFDITDRKAAEQQLQRSERLLQESQDTARIGSYVTDLSTGRWEGSRVMDELFGVDQTFVHDIPNWNSLLHPEDRARALQHYQEVIEKEQPFRMDYRVIRPSDGQIRWMAAYGGIERDAAGKPTRLLGCIQDITEQREAAEAQSRLMLAIDQCSDSIVFTDPKGVMLYVNRGFELVSGYDRSEVLGENAGIISSGEHPASFYKEMWDCISHGKVWNGRFVNCRKDGEIFKEDTTISPILHLDGTIKGYVAVKRDVTRELLLSQQVAEVQRMEAVGQLAGGIAHDYNNILGAGMLLMDLLLSEPGLQPELQRGLEELRKGHERAANLTRQLLAFSRRQAMVVKPLNLQTLLNGVMMMLRRLLGERIVLAFKTETEIPWIDGDAGMIEQVVMNLCINARDAMPKGGQIQVLIRRIDVTDTASSPSPKARTGSFICLSVTDTGTGMSPEILSKIFRPFFTTKEIGRGTGLGLATVSGIVDQHQGWIEVESEVGKGSEFRVLLPARNPVLPSGESVAPTPAAPVTLLIVEDEPDLRSTLVRSLQTQGHTVFEAGNGPEALRTWIEHGAAIQILLTDMIMPQGMTGLELALACRQSRPNLPVILMSGYSAEIAAAGVPDLPDLIHLAKPFDLATLARAIEQMHPLTRHPAG